MPAPWNPPKRGEDFIIGIGLEDPDVPGSFKANPTIEAGDFKVSKDFGAFANLTTLPAVAPASGRQVQVTLSATEMTADGVMIQGVDQTSPKEWNDFMLFIPTTQ